MVRKTLLRLAAIVCLLPTAGCIHLGSQGRGDVHEDYSVAPPPPPPPPVRESAAPHRRLSFQIQRRRLLGTTAFVVRIPLSAVRLRLCFADGAPQPSSQVESFESLCRRAGPSLVSSGAFFGERTHRTLGTLISGGRTCQRESQDREGTALILDRYGRVHLQTLRVDRVERPCRFYLQAGPRLVRDGKLWLHPAYEGFGDPALLDKARRVAIGLTDKGRELLLVGFPLPVSLSTEATAMFDLGTSDAMNLDGGASAALAVDGHAWLSPSMPLTHVLVFEPRG